MIALGDAALKHMVVLARQLRKPEPQPNYYRPNAD